MGAPLRHGTLVALLALASIPAAAGAQAPPGGYVEGGVDTAAGISCPSIPTGRLIVEPQVTLGAAAQSSAARRPRAGEVFYARALIGIVGTTCSGAAVTLEVIPPAGVEVRVDDEHPIWFDYVVNQSPDPQDGRTGTIRTGAGEFGGVGFQAFFDGQLQPIPLANDSGPVELHVPLVASRRLDGGDPNCRAQGSGAPPCSRNQAADQLQIAARVGASLTPTLLVADAALFAAGPGRPAVTYRRGRLTVQTAPQARIRATITRGGRRLARLTGRTSAAGTATLRLPRRARVRGARISVVATTTDGAASPAARTVVR